MAATTPTSCPASVLTVAELWEQPHLHGSFEGGVGRGSTAGMVVVGHGAGAGPRVLRQVGRAVVGCHQLSCPTRLGAHFPSVGQGPGRQSTTTIVHGTHALIASKMRIRVAAGREIAGDIIS